MTSLEFLPNGWELKTINEIGDLHSGSTPSTRVAAYWNGEIVWITPNDLSNLNTRFINSSERTITYQGLKNSSAKLLPARSLVISSRAPIGYLALPTSEFCTNQGCKSLVFGEEQNPEFHYYNFSFRVRQIREKGEGTTFAEISKTALGQIAFPVPKDRHTQTKIAEVLTAVDQAITQTETLIAKYQRIRTGLMQDLLTQGIDENGNLRDPATHEFKDTDIGYIPKEWNVEQLNKVILIHHGYAFSGKFFSEVDNGPILLTPGNFSVKGGLYFTSKNTKYYTGYIPNEYVLKNGDVLVVMTDLTKEMAILGNTVRLNHPYPVLHNQRIGRVEPLSNDDLDLDFLVHLMNSYYCKSIIKLTATGTTVKHTSPNKIRSALVPLPSLGEQKRITSNISKFETHYKLLQKQLKKLRKLKTGLMQDLLTGNVSVVPLLNSTEEG